MVAFALVAGSVVVACEPAEYDDSRDLEYATLSPEADDYAWPVQDFARAYESAQSPEERADLVAMRYRALLDYPDLRAEILPDTNDAAAAQEQNLEAAEVETCQLEYETDTHYGSIGDTDLELGGMWPSGRVPYVPITGFPADELNAILTAMAELQAAVPGLEFVAIPQATGRYLEFTRDNSDGNGCSSGFGRPAEDGARRIKLAAIDDTTNRNSCILARSGNITYSVHHEILHALGVHHEQARKDRDNFVRVDWEEIIGCAAGSTSSDGTVPTTCGSDQCDTPTKAVANCGCKPHATNPVTMYHAECTADRRKSRANNFAISLRSASVGSYNYESIMHYHGRGFRNGRGDGTTLNPLQLDPDTGLPYAIGNRRYLSDGDILTLNAMYPEPRLRSVVFSGIQSVQSVCRLQGREDDLATSTRFYALGEGCSSVNSFGWVYATNGGAEYCHAACYMQSAFWSQGYDYPNQDGSFHPFNYPAADREYYSSHITPLAVLPAGMIPVMF